MLVRQVDPVQVNAERMMQWFELCQWSHPETCEIKAFAEFKRIRLIDIQLRQVVSYPREQRGWRNKGAGEGKGLEKERGRRNKGAGEAKGPENQRGWRRKGGRRSKGAGEGEGPEKQRAGETKGHVTTRHIFLRHSP